MKKLCLILLILTASPNIFEKFSGKDFIKQNQSIFKEIKIGDQVWMAENLNVDKFRNGDPIPQAKSNNEWKKAYINKKPAWCYYKSSNSNGVTYGKLYNWYAVNDKRGLAPEGWHIPTRDEWMKLTDNFGGTLGAGVWMKSKTGWVNNGNGRDLSGFNGLPGGYRSVLGEFRQIGEVGYWWSCTETNWKSAALNAEYVSLSDSNNELYDYHRHQGEGMSVRCIKD